MRGCGLKAYALNKLGDSAMKAILNWIRIAALFVFVSLLVSCGGGGSSTPPSTAYYV
jgi:hypothetical protein